MKSIVKDMGYRVIRKVGHPEIIKRILKDVTEALQNINVDKPFNIYPKICKCRKCNKEFILVKIDLGNCYYETKYSLWCA